MDTQQCQTPGEKREGQPRGTQATLLFQQESVEVDVVPPDHPPEQQKHEGKDGSETRHHQQWKAHHITPQSKEDQGEDTRKGDLLGEAQVIFASGRGVLRSPLENRRLAKAVIERIVGAHADAIETLHAVRVHDHGILTNLLMHPDVGGANCSAVATLVAGIGDADTGRRQLIQRTEEPAVWTGIGTESLGAEKIHRGETADQQKRNRQPHPRKCLPEISRGQRDTETRPGQLRLRPRRDRQPVKRRPHEHIQPQDQRHEYQQTRAERPGPDVKLLHDPAAQILEHHHVTSPATQPSPEKERPEQSGDKKDEPGVDDSPTSELHCLGRLDGRDGGAGDPPLDNVGDDQKLYDAQHHGPSRGVLRAANRD